MQEHHRDTVITTVRDSAMMRALLECDSSGNVIMRQLDIAQGQLNAKIAGAWLRPPLKAGDQFRLDVKFVADSLRQEIALRDKIISNFKTDTRVVEVARDFSWWETTLMWLGGINITIIVVVIGYLIIKIWKKR